MNILAIDTLDPSVAIISYGKVLGENSIEKNTQAELLICKIEELLQEYNYSFNDLSAFFATKGPGSFMGIKIGIAALQGLSLIAKKPAYGISRLEVTAFMLAKDNPDHKNIQAILNAGRDYVYQQKFSSTLDPLTKPKIIKFQDMKLDDFLSGGDIDSLPNFITPHSNDLGLLAYDKIHKNQIQDIELKPLYVRE